MTARSSALPSADPPRQAEPAAAPLRWAAPALLLLGATVYANSLHGTFLLDDFSSIHESPNARIWWPPWASVPTRPEIALAGRPIPSFSIAVNYALGGLNPLGYHLVNVGLHLLNALLLFGILRRTLARRPQPADGPAAAAGIALAATALWMVHPLLTDSVDYIIQRTELFMAAFLLATLYSVIRGAEAASPRRRAGWYAAAVGSCALGMASKEVMVVAPLLVLLYDRVFLSASWREVMRHRETLHAGLAATWLLLALLVSGGWRPTTTGFNLPQITPWQYLLTQSGVLLHYLRLAVWPHPLAADYVDWPVAVSLAQAWPTMAGVAALLGLTGWALSRRPAAGFLGAWAFLLLAPTSSILPILTEFVAERRMYLPLAALAVLAVVGGWRLLGRLRAAPALRQRWAAGLLAAALAACAALTVSRNADYRTEERLLRDLLAKRPANVTARYNLGIVLEAKGDAAGAMAEFEATLRLAPDYAKAHNNLGVLLMRQDRLDEAAAHYAETMRLRPELWEPHSNLGELRVRRGDLAGAVAAFREAVRLDPTAQKPQLWLAEALRRLQQGAAPAPDATGGRP